MATNRQWRHGIAYDSVGNGVATLSIEITGGDYVVSGGGFAEPLDYNNTQASSTSTSSDHASAQCPIVYIDTEYDSVRNSTSLNLGFAVTPGGKCVGHVFATWEA